MTFARRGRRATDPTEPLDSPAGGALQSLFRERSLLSSFSIFSPYLDLILSLSLSVSVRPKNQTKKNRL